MPPAKGGGDQLLSAAVHVGTLYWNDFVAKYLNTEYPGHELPTAQRRERERTWDKSWNTFRRERNALDAFTRIVHPGLIHEISAHHQTAFLHTRLEEVGSARTVDAELRAPRYILNVAEKWDHRPRESNPFAGYGNATVGLKRRRVKEEGRKQKEKHYTLEQVRALLARVTEESRAEGSTWEQRRLWALIYFLAYTGCRIDEVLHLEWHEANLEEGVAFLHHKRDHTLKTESSVAPFGMSDRLIEVLREWQTEKTCSWVFPALCATLCIAVANKDH